MREALLQVEGLRASVGPLADGLPIIRNVSFEVASGEVLGVIGESGSGKTVTMMAVLRLLPEQIQMSAERLEFAGIDLRELGPREFGALRGTRFAMVFQDPTGAFNPAKTIGWHLRAIMKRAGGRSPALAERARRWKPAAMKLLGEVGITRDASILNQYPHQLSGGMLQRALIALVLALEPDLIVADEPTTNLDNIVERQIVELFREIKGRIRSAMIFITHDISIAQVLCDRIAVMYAGQIVEIGRTRDILERPLHPYTRSLIAASTELDLHPRRLTEIAGEGPVLSGPLDRCSFEPRCPLAHPPCAACSMNPSSPPLLRVRNLVVEFALGNPLISLVTGRRRRLRAVDEVSFGLEQGEVVGIVGESGSGKTTVGKTVLRLNAPTSGEIVIRGQDIAPLSARALKPLRRSMQMVFQDPLSSLNPRHSVRRSLAAPLKVHRLCPSGEIDGRVDEMLSRVGLPRHFKTRFPHELSGGQLQRVAIGRALMLQPRLIVADESVSKLDVSERV